MQLHLRGNLLTNRAVFVNTIDDVFGQFAEILLLVFRGLGLIFKQQHEGTAPFVERGFYFGDVAQGVVCWLLANAENTHDEIAATCLRENAHRVFPRRFSVFNQLEFRF